MEITKDTVKYVAHLARIELTQKELEVLSVQLQDILAFIDKLQRVETSNIPPTSHILPVQNVLREDSIRQSISPEEALKNAPAGEEGFFTVPKVIE